MGYISGGGGAIKLSQLEIDVDKDWGSFMIRNMADPLLAQDAATKNVVPDVSALMASVKKIYRRSGEMVVMESSNDQVGYIKMTQFIRLM